MLDEFETSLKPDAFRKMIMPTHQMPCIDSKLAFYQPHLKFSSRDSKISDAWNGFQPSFESTISRFCTCALFWDDFSRNMDGRLQIDEQNVSGFENENKFTIPALKNKKVNSVCHAWSSVLTKERWINSCKCLMIDRLRTERQINAENMPWCTAFECRKAKQSCNENLYQKQEGEAIYHTCNDILSRR